MTIENKIQLKRPELIYLFLAITALAFIFFGNGIRGPFLYDDEWVILRNPTVASVSQIPEQFISSYHYLQPETGLYRPLTIVSYTFNFVFGKNPAGFHVVNILLYAINAFLVFLLIFKLFSSKRLAYPASALFFFFSIHTEAATFISGRSDLLAFFFALLALLLLFAPVRGRSAESGVAATSGRPASNGVKEKYWFGSLAFLFSLLSKESAVILVPVVFAFWLWRSGRENLKAIVKKLFLYFSPPAVIYGLLRYAALKGNFLANDATYIYNPLKFADAPARFFTALKVMALYIWKTFIPLHLSADYSFNQIPLLHSIFNFPAMAGLFVLLAAILVLFWNKTKTTPLAFGSVLFLSSYFVISNFVFSIGTILAERTFYLPSLGVALVVAFVLDKLMSWKFRNFWLALLVLACLFWGALIIKQNRVWLSQESLYENMIRESPDSVHAKTNLGVYYIQQGRWDEGKELLEEVYKIAPDHVPNLDALGIVAEHEKRYSDAEKFYLKALEVSPLYATAMSNLGRMYFQLGRYQKSADLYWRAFSYKNQAGSLLVYAMSESKLGKYDEAIAVIKKYYGEDPKNLNLKFALGYAYYKKGDRATADKYFKESKNPNISDEDFIKSIEKF